MFHSTKKHTKITQDKINKYPSTVLTAQELLSAPKRQTLLHNIQIATEVETTLFENYFLTLIQNVVKHSQSLPETANSYYAAACGLIDHSLNRTEAALQIFRQYLVQPNNAEITKEQQLWLYALFSAAMLQGLGKIPLDFAIELLEIKNLQVSAWNPLSEPFMSLNYRYNYEFLLEGDYNMRRCLNVLMAKILMPQDGFNWIASNKPVWLVWLSLLHEDWGSAGTLGAILRRANDISIQNYWHDLLLQHENNLGQGKRSHIFVDSVPADLLKKEQLLGAQFIEWLKQALAKNQFKLNQSPIVMVNGGLMLLPEVFQLFIKDHGEFISWQAAQKALLSLGVNKRGPDGKAIIRINDNLSGIILKNAIILPNNVTVSNPNTGKKQTMSALDIEHAFHSSTYTTDTYIMPSHEIQHLAPQGTWVNAHSIQSTTPGPKHRG